MASPEVEFMCQSKIKQQFDIDIPPEVFNSIQEYSSEDSIEYIWNYDTRNDTVLISPEKPRFEDINKLKGTIDHQTGGRTTVPKPVKKKYELEVKDNLYFWTHDMMCRAGAPSVIVWDFDRIQGLFQEVISSMSEEELFPNF
jgi:hypothetical protein